LMCFFGGGGGSSNLWKRKMRKAPCSAKVTKNSVLRVIDSTGLKT